jgi:hypothetical protein
MLWHLGMGTLNVVVGLVCEQLIMFTQLAGVLLKLGHGLRFDLADLTINLVKSSGLMLELGLQLDRQLLDALFQVAMFSGTLVDELLARFQLGVVRADLGSQIHNDGVQLFNDLFALCLSLLEGCALSEEINDLVRKLKQLAVHEQLTLFVQLAACALEQLLVLQESMGIARGHRL